MYTKGTRIFNKKKKTWIKLNLADIDTTWSWNTTLVYVETVEKAFSSLNNFKFAELVSEASIMG